ncbi:MAG: ABC transporter substrate-binding protein [Nitriliruptorales bacterium]|nr:ABC transporter substrate-binding protein [Nitriliruptorales bacterium]
MLARWLALFVVLLLGLAACGGGEPVDVDGDESADAGGDEVAGGTLIAAISGEPDQLDPHQTSAYASFQVLENVYDTLVQPTEELEFEPALATEWQVSDDQLTWTFTLREGVSFHDGSDFTADDVAFSYNRIIDEELANAYRFTSVTEVRAADDMTVEIEVDRPTPNLLANIGAFKGMSIVPEEFDDEMASSPVGTGPFQFESHSEGQSIELSANPEYWGDGPSLDGVTFRFISEGTVALTNLQGGEAHWTDNIPPQQIEQLSDDDSLVLESVPSTDYWYFAANQTREPFDKPEVRQALAWAIDREAVTSAAKFDAATVNQTAIPEGSAFYTDYAPYEHDPDRGRELLKEAGVEDLEVELMVTDEYPETVQAAQVLETQWGEVGISTNIRTLDFATWLDEQGEGNFDVFMLGWLGNIDPDDYYYAQHHSEGGFNFHGYANSEVDDLLDQAREETEDDARKELYDEAVQMIVDEASYVYLYNPDVVQAWVPEVEGYTVRSDRAIRFENVALNQ